MYTGPHIITDNLVLSADAGSLRSYISGSSIVNNPATPGYSGSLDNLDNTTFNRNNGGFWDFTHDPTTDEGQFIVYPPSDLTQGDVANAITYECWVNRQDVSLDTNARIMSTDLSDYNTIYVNANGEGNVVWGVNIGGSRKSRQLISSKFGSPVLPTNQWFHILATATYNGSDTYSQAIYRNGVLGQETVDGSASGTWGDGTSRPFGIFCNVEADAAPRDGFNGQMACFRVYTRFFSQAEVLQNYNAQKSRFGY
tara:strand:- start:412 stop:1173 length:762 start_codon:yes stop_codon:yes gene_type:complete